MRQRLRSTGCRGLELGGKAEMQRPQLALSVPAMGDGGASRRRSGLGRPRDDGTRVVTVLRRGRPASGLWADAEGRTAELGTGGVSLLVLDDATQQEGEWSLAGLGLLLPWEMRIEIRRQRKER